MTAGEKYEAGSIEEKLITLPVTQGTLQYCGIENVDFKVFYQVPQSTQEQREAMLQEVREIAATY